MKEYKELYKKNKLTFALIWIAVYVVTASIADGISEGIGISKIITVPLLLVLSGVAYIWI